MKEWLKDYFTFNQSEQRGLILLLGLLLLSILFNYFSPLLVKEKNYNSDEFRAQVEAFLNDTLSVSADFSQEWGDPFKKSKSEEHSGPENFASHPFYFDPNQMSEEEWNKTGLDEQVIRNILKYRQKGGFFKRKEDLRKIYALELSAYKVLEPYIIINDELKYNARVPSDSTNPDKEITKPYPIPDETAHIVELNSADSAGLISLPGIGPSFASRIIRYRQILGGYSDISQLMEVKGMDSNRFNGIKDRLGVNPELVRRMDLNAVTFKEMLKHPYFEFYLVKEIFNYRDRIKEFDSVGQIRQISIIYPELFNKIAPYLEVSKPGFE